MKTLLLALIMTGVVLKGAAPTRVEVALDNPIPATIVPGEIVVRVEEFVRMPRTVDSSDNYTNAAWARIQYLQPFGNTHGTLIVNDTRGVLYLTNDRGVAPQVYLDMREQDVGFYDALFPNEMGLSGVAFHPEFTSIGKPGFGKFYTAYSARNEGAVPTYLKADAAGHVSVIREWTTYNPRGKAFVGESREIFRVGQFAPNHNIGSLAFNPMAETGSADYGMLYAGLGDGGAANDPKGYGQNLAAPLGAIIRIDPLGGRDGKAYAIPTDNPFVGRAGVAPEIWAYGLRNPQHFSWSAAGAMYICDIGQNQIEEVNLGRAGANYGWRNYEGSFATAFAVADGVPGKVYPLSERAHDMVYPIAEYDHDEGRAISSGFVYEGSAIPELIGKFVFADLVNGRVFYQDLPEPAGSEPRHGPIKALRLSFAGEERPLAEVTSFADSYGPGMRVDLRLGVDALGELYLLTKGDGWIRKMLPLGGQ